MEQEHPLFRGSNNLATTLKKLWKNEYFQTATVIILIVVVVFGFWFGSQIILNTKIPPALAVVSGSMCVPYDGACEGWLSLDHPFDRTLHKGDLIIIQGVDPKTLNTNYPNSDIIVYQDPRYPNDPDQKIVHRIVAVEDRNGTLWFYTKGDGNNPPDVWPNPVSPGVYDPWSPVPQDYIYGKVIMRIPWIGHIAIAMRGLVGSNNNFIIPIVVILIVLLIIVEFIAPLLKRKPRVTQQQDTQPQPS
jgi:signal peptidase I